MKTLELAWKHHSLSKTPTRVSIINCMETRKMLSIS